jgi:phosphate transport system substrate-binding protein
MRWREPHHGWPTSKRGSTWDRTEVEPRRLPHAFRESVKLAPARYRLPKRLILALVAAIGILGSAGTLIALAVSADGRPDQEPLPLPPLPPSGPVVRLAGSGFVASKVVPVLAAAWAAAPRSSGVRVETQTVPRASGLIALLREDANFWITAGPAEEADIDAARQAGFAQVPPLAQWRRPGSEYQIATAALVLLANRDNPVSALTLAQASKLFTGQFTAWAQLGGRSNMPVGRLVLAADREETGWFCAVYLGQADASRCLRSVGLTIEPPMDATAPLIEKVADSPAVIGYAEFADRGIAKALAFGTGCGRPIAPTAFRIKAGDYPATQRLYIYTLPGRTPSGAGKGFLYFAVGSGGQAALSAHGLVDAAPMLDEDITADGQRLSLTFRFAGGSAALDATSEGDLARLIAWMRQPSLAKAQITLIGHADAAEAAPVALERARAVQARLQTTGGKSAIAIKVGTAEPVDCVSDSTTAALNRRVEVWVRNGR